MTISIRRILTATIVGATLMGAAVPAFAANWIPLNDNVQFDAESAKPIQDGYSMWLRYPATKGIGKIEISCKDDTVDAVAGTTYNDDGSVGTMAVYDREPDLIAPGTVFAEVHKILCK